LKKYLVKKGREIVEIDETTFREWVMTGKIKPLTLVASEITRWKFVLFKDLGEYEVPPSVPSEKVYLDKIFAGNTKMLITSSRVVINETTVPLNNVSMVTIKRIPPNYQPYVGTGTFGAVLVLMGVVFAIAACVSMEPDEGLIFWMVICILAVFFGIALLGGAINGARNLREFYVVYIVTNAREFDGVAVATMKEAKSIKDAIDLALSEQGTRQPLPPWKCDYCNSLVEGERSTCPKCGAPKPNLS
ncbi:MAG: DUF6232 family protein, partial [candidate division WOR-3 bacterium]